MFGVAYPIDPKAAADLLRSRVPALLLVLLGANSMGNCLAGRLIDVDE
jgi:hypothetical protein